jgi:hypothetical protein
MRLKGNERQKIINKLNGRILSSYAWDSKMNIWRGQDIFIGTLICSNDLIYNIRNEIDRE